MIDATEKDARLYRTPAWVTEAILPRLTVHLAGNGSAETYALEPCAGDGAIVKVLLAHGYDVEAVEMEQARADAMSALCIDAHCGDVREVIDDHNDCDYGRTPEWVEFDLVITNPPFASACAIWEACWECLRPGGQIAFLNRLSWLSSRRRAEFWKRYPADVYVLPSRPSFVPSGKIDMWDYAWFVGTRDGRTERRWEILDVERP